MTFCMSVRSTVTLLWPAFSFLISAKVSWSSWRRSPTNFFALFAVGAFLGLHISWSCLETTTANFGSSLMFGFTSFGTCAVTSFGGSVPNSVLSEQLLDLVVWPPVCHFCHCSVHRWYVNRSVSKEITKN